MRGLLAVGLVAAVTGLVSGVAHTQGVVVDKSEIRFVSRQMGVNVEGRFRKWKANVVFLPADLGRSKAEFDVDLASIDLASEDSEQEVKGQLWFDTSRFPVAHFASTTIRNTGPDRYDVVGKLSIKGVTRDATVPILMRKDGSGGTIAEGTFNVKRLEYKIGEGQWADTQTVEDPVVVRVKVVLAPVK